MNFWLTLSGIYGFLGVALGAFAAHGLKSRLDEYALGIFQTATHYQLVHAVALFAGALVLQQMAANPWILRACQAWSLGILIFSGSLYALALTGIKVLGAITPIGGVFFLLGWISIAIAGLKA